MHDAIFDYWRPVCPKMDSKKWVAYQIAVSDLHLTENSRLLCLAGSLLGFVLGGTPRIDSVNSVVAESKAASVDWELPKVQK